MRRAFHFRRISTKSEAPFIETANPAGIETRGLYRPVDFFGLLEAPDQRVPALQVLLLN